MINLSKPKIKNLKKYICYTATTTLNNISEIQDFILLSAKQCKKLNPNIKCPKNDYCFGIFMDNKVNLKHFTYKYYQAVTKTGKENNLIKFESLDKSKVISFEYIGPYSKFKKVYKTISKKLKHLGISVLDILSPIREVYIDGPWNKEDPNEYKTEFQVPITKNLEIDL